MDAFALDVSNNTPITDELAAIAKKQGVVALIAKATEGSSYKDPTLAYHRKVAAKAGLRFGMYLFLHSHSPGSEAGEFLRYAKPRPTDVVVLDVEGGGVDEDSIGAMAARTQLCAAALEAKGFRPVMYCSASWWLPLVQAEPRLKRLPVWEAQYPGLFARWVPSLAAKRQKLQHGASVVMWQWTDRFAVGVHHYDCSRLFVPVNKL